MSRFRLESRSINMYTRDFFYAPKFQPSGLFFWSPQRNSALKVGIFEPPPDAILGKKSVCLGWGSLFGL